MAQTGRFFAPDKLKSHISKGNSEEEERRRRETAMLAFLVFILATLGYGLTEEVTFLYETTQEYSMLISFTHNSWILS